MFEKEFDFAAFADFFAFFIDKILKSIFQTKDWLTVTADSLK